MTDRTITAATADALFNQDDGITFDGWTRVCVQDMSVGRWRVHRVLVLCHQDSGEHWGIDYADGLTEMQDSERPWEGVTDDFAITLTRLYPRTVTRTVYSRLPQVT
ncbi:MAG: hypothetical protein WAM94_12570 [Chromatiaceae bacterium]